MPPASPHLSIAPIGPIPPRARKPAPGSSPRLARHLATLLLTLLVLATPAPIAAAAPSRQPATPPSWITFTGLFDDISEAPLGLGEPALVGLPLVLTARASDPALPIPAAVVEWEPGRVSPRVAFDPTDRTASFRTTYGQPGGYTILPRPADSDQPLPGTVPYALTVESQSQALSRLQAWLRDRLRLGDHPADAASDIEYALRELEQAAAALETDDDARLVNALILAAEQLATIEEPTTPRRAPYYRRLSQIAWIRARQQIDRAGAFDSDTTEHQNLMLAEEWLKAGQSMLRRGYPVAAMSPFEQALLLALSVR